MDIFISRPTVIGAEFEDAHATFRDHLVASGFRFRRLGGGDYSKKAPLRAVIDLIKECCGAIVLGYPQVEFQHQVRRNTRLQNDFQCVYPTPWNQIEGALAYAHGLPVLVIAHPGISGGVFDHGITGEGVLHLDLAKPDWYREAQFTQPFNEWSAEVKQCARRLATPP